jgi:hypothetical protein
MKPRKEDGKFMELNILMKLSKYVKIKEFIRKREN